MSTKIFSQIFISLILALPFSCFLFTKLDIWYTQGYFAQLLILVLYSLHLYKKSKPFGVLFLWVGVMTIFYCISTQVSTKQLPILLILPFINLICIAVLFDIITKYVKKENYITILKWYPIILLVLSVYAILQKFSLDQFFQHFNTAGLPDEIVGTIGNPMHFAHYLTICLPMVFCLVTKYRNPLILLILFAISLTGSLSGLIIALLLIGFYQYHYRLYSIREICLFLTLVVLFLLYKRPDIGFVSDSGRIAVWREYLDIFKEKPITGWGIGIINAMASKKDSILYSWRHLHNEFYHFTIELGLVGLGIIIWGIVDYFKHFKKDSIGLSINLVFIGFLLCSLFGYPAHLWVLSTLGILAYSYNYLDRVTLLEV
jgi:O-antigen ligase